MPVILALGRQRQEDWISKVILVYIIDLRQDPDLKHQILAESEGMAQWLKVLDIFSEDES